MALLSTTDFPHQIVKTEGFAHKRIDLHSHTNCSDGGLSPQSLIDRAANFQIDVLAITDHDTVAALDIAQKHIDEKKIPLKLINGIEISTAWQGFEIHIVGLNIDKNNPELKALIALQQQAREQRAISMGEKLEKCGFPTIYTDAKAMAGEGSITRAHFAKVLHQQGHVNTMQQAFDKYIGKKGSKGQRAYVKPNWCNIEEAVQAIHHAGGSAVMAHPIRYDLSAKWLRRLIVHFSEVAGDGLEVVLPQMNPEQRQKMLAYCQEYNLHASMGSDFHYPNRWSDIGRNLTMPVGAKPIWAQWQ
ncbi:RNase RNM [Colwellia sp. 12G3]|uniref:RNase RNM n=1 Tax=Colwellia sp. 12G3 TaxID=2058299 RepID=UPI000C34CD8E|nr:PHP domain-containing protein [Colwellia sp. 12G3]PKI16909.1 phosphatase [Colwellia sp. 12G3]